VAYQVASNVFGSKEINVLAHAVYRRHAKCHYPYGNMHLEMERVSHRALKLSRQTEKSDSLGWELRTSRPILESLWCGNEPTIEWLWPASRHSVAGFRLVVNQNRHRRTKYPPRAGCKLQI
jgi:hypothetical protein